MHRSGVALAVSLLAGCSEAPTLDILRVVERDGGSGEGADFGPADVPPGDPDIGPVEDGGGPVGQARLLTRELDLGVHAPGSQSFHQIAIAGDPDRATTIRVQRFDSERSLKLRSMSVGQWVTIPAGGRMTIDLVFEPDSTGRIGASMEIDLCAGTMCRERVAIGGVVTDTVLDCSSVDLGNVPVGACTSLEAVCVNNTDDALVVESLNAAGDVYFSISGPPGEIAPHARAVFPVGYCPRSPGEHRADVFVQLVPSPAHFRAFSQVMFVVSGRSIAEECNLFFESMIDFGAVQVNTTVEREVLVQNTGTGFCEVSSLGLAGTSTTFSLLEPSAGTRLGFAQGGSFPVRVGFLASAPASHRDRALFASNDPRHPTFEIALFASTITGGSFRVEIQNRVPLMPQMGTPFRFQPNDDDGSDTIRLPFPFNFLGRPVSEVYVSTNGFIAFDPNGLSRLSPEPIPSPNPPNAFVAWWWDDLHPGIGMASTSWTVSGAPPNRVLHITFTNVPHFGGPPSSTVSAEIRLREIDQVIEVHYGELTDPAGGHFQTGVGWESDAGLNGADVLGCSPFCASMQWPAFSVYRYIPQ
jgi:hypothetical protein